MAIIEVLATDGFVEWYESQTTDVALAVERTVTYLEVVGHQVGVLLAETGATTGLPVYELRMPGPSEKVGVCYAFDASRKVVLLLAGDASGSRSFCAAHLAVRGQRGDQDDPGGNGHDRA